MLCKKCGVEKEQDNFPKVKIKGIEYFRKTCKTFFQNMILIDIKKG
jgi:uncharacterized metal-binding protein